MKDKKLKAAATPPPVDPEKSWNFYLAPIIREALYTNGEPPAGWSIAQDLRICKTILKNGRFDALQIEAAIRGLRKLYPKAPHLTLRLLVADRDGSLYRRAVEAHYNGQKRKPAATSLGDILRQIAGGAPDGNRAA
jgi:hypothetical protein